MTIKTFSKSEEYISELKQDNLNYQDIVLGSYKTRWSMNPEKDGIFRVLFVITK